MFELIRDQIIAPVDVGGLISTRLSGFSDTFTLFITCTVFFIYVLSLNTYRRRTDMKLWTLLICLTQVRNVNMWTAGGHSEVTGHETTVTETVQSVLVSRFCASVNQTAADQKR